MDNEEDREGERLGEWETEPSWGERLEARGEGLRVIGFGSEGVQDRT